MAKQAKDPWAKGSIEDTLTSRKEQFQSLMNVVHAMDGDLQAKIAEELMKGTDDSTPNYELINRGNKRKYDSEKANAVKNLIEDHYSLKNKLSPFRKALDEAKLDPASRKLVENIYSGHKDALKRGVGNSKYGQLMRQVQDRNATEVQESILSVSHAGYEADTHGDNVVAHFQDQYKLDMGRIDSDRLKRDLHQAIRAHIQGTADADLFYDLAPQYEKKKAAHK